MVGDVTLVRLDGVADDKATDFKTLCFDVIGYYSAGMDDIYVEKIMSQINEKLKTKQTILVTEMNRPKTKFLQSETPCISKHFNTFLNFRIFDKI